MAVISVRSTTREANFIDILEVFFDVRELGINMAVHDYLGPVRLRVASILPIMVNIVRPSPKMIRAKVDAIPDLQRRRYDADMVATRRIARLLELIILGEGDMMLRKNASRYPRYEHSLHE